MNDFVVSKELSNIIVGNVLGILVGLGLITAYGLVFHIGIKILEKTNKRKKQFKEFKASMSNEDMVSENNNLLKECEELKQLVSTINDNLLKESNEIKQNLSKVNDRIIAEKYKQYNYEKEVYDYNVFVKELVSSCDLLDKKMNEYKASKNYTPIN